MIEDPQIIRNIELFKSLSEEAIRVILKSRENSIEEYQSKQIIIREDGAFKKIS